MILRGVAAVIFGVIAIAYPSAAASAFVIVFAVFAFADGILDFFLAASLGSAGMRWGWYVFAALVSIAAGVAALAYPSITFLALVFLVAARAIVMGFLEVGAAASWRDLDDRWLLGLVGVLSIVLGVLLFSNPSTGGLALVWTIGFYAIVMGAAVGVLGIRLLRDRDELAKRLSSAHAA
jgi:uncharacterized membrane protein HdeD (DUF308 family)